MKNLLEKYAAFIKKAEAGQLPDLPRFTVPGTGENGKNIADTNATVCQMAGFFRMIPDPESKFYSQCAAILDGISDEYERVTGGNTDTGKMVAAPQELPQGTYAQVGRNAPVPVSIPEPTYRPHYDDANGSRPTGRGQTARQRALQSTRALPDYKVPEGALDL